jgi:DNA mismatch endonuclease (patch repair protein)
MPASNRAFWEAKLAANRLRDADTDRRLRADGWTVVRVWEHEDPVVAADRLCKLLAEV